MARASPPIVEAFTDGSCRGNPGPGGWGVVLRYGKVERELSGGEPATTNNRMELTAAIMALESLRRPAALHLYTDSTYVHDGITKWLAQWQRRGWRTADKKPLKNLDLWQRLLAAATPHRVTWHWVRGHAGHRENDRADALARRGLEETEAAQRPAGVDEQPTKAPSGPPRRSTPRRRRAPPR